MNVEARRSPIYHLGATPVKSIGRLCGVLLFGTLAAVCLTRAQSPTTDVEGRLRVTGSGQIIGLRIRLTRQSGSRQFMETFTQPDGRFSFRQVTAGDYLVEIPETADFYAAAASVSVQPTPSMGRTVVSVLIDLVAKPSGARSSSVVMADVDAKVPEAAFKHYRAGLKALESKDSARAISELRAAIQIYPDYYAARLELGRELRAQKRFEEATETLKTLSQLAPGRAEPHLEYALVLLGLERREQAISELHTALELEEKSWAPHYFLGLALFDSNGEVAEKEFQRALELNEKKAARSHVALARLALRKGQQEVALKHLDTYLALEPNAPDAETVRKFAQRLRSGK